MGTPLIESPDLATRLGRFVEGLNGSAAVVVSSLRRISGGMSREAWAVDLTVDREAVACILMRSAEAGLLVTDRAREFHLLASLADRGLPVPEVLWLDPTGGALERPAFLMRRASGVADRRRLEQEKLAKQIDDEFVLTLASLHAIPPSEIRLDEAVPDAADVARAQVDVWTEGITDDELQRVPGLAEVIGWLRDRAEPAARVGLVHGDYRYGNFLFDDTGITAILDWELAHYGDPHEDLVWSFRPFRRGTEPIRSLPEFIEAYERASGWEVDPRIFAYYRILAELKTAAIFLTGVRARRSSGGDLSLLVPAQLVVCSVRQALAWIDELEGSPCST